MSINLPIQSDFDLRNLTTFGIAARARFYVRITNPEQLGMLDKTPALAGLPRLILGGGSNLILTGDFPGVVVHMALAGRTHTGEDADHHYIQAAAGEVWHDFVLWTISQGWGGLENLSLIPGSVGAAPIQNIGAYGVELNDVFHSLNWYEFATGKIHQITDCRFAYRDSIFKQALHEKGVILNVTFALPKNWQARLGYGDVAKAVQAIGQPTPLQISQAICSIRQSKLPDPVQIGNAGSFFKNPVVSGAERESLLHRFPSLVSYPHDDRYKLAAGWLIEQAGWKGRSMGPVGVYEKQALVLVNLGGAVGRDVVCLSRAIQEDVLKKFGVQLEVEPVFV